MTNRRDFVKMIALLPLTGAAMKLNTLNKLTGAFAETETMPVLFLGHGNPMNAIEENEFTKGWADAGNSITKPNAILCISAHWETKGTFVTAMDKPRTIHDFGGFPQALFDMQYPAPGDLELANETKAGVTRTPVGFNYNWGLDHGCWVVISRLYPKADVPVIQLSLDYSKPAQWHFELAKELAFLRKKGVLIIGSGNMVHNLGMLNWQDDKTFDWAIEANDKIKQLINTHDYKSLEKYDTLGKAIQLAVPTPEHYLPLLYTLALKEDKENLAYFNDKTVMGSISMTSLRIG
jgi:4,5-DOPA dioxygenase extradiol